MIENRPGSPQKYERIRELMTDVVETLGLDLADDSLPKPRTASPRCTCTRSSPASTTAKFPRSR
jgi:hypothetical protein